MKFRPDIEGLRAIAVLSVVAFHFGVLFLPGGFVGVDIFFVISGYLITTLLREEFVVTGTISLPAFYGRRARRLLPAASLVLIFTLCVGTLFLSPHEQFNSSKAAAASSVYGSNVYFVLQLFDYFSEETALNPFLHTWSLAVEEQFYLFWPAIVLLVLHLARQRPAIIRIGFGAATVASFALCAVLAVYKPKWGFYGFPARVWEFGVGAIATQLAGPRSKILQRATEIAGLAIIIGSCVLITGDLRFPFPWAILPVLGAALVLVAGSTTNQTLLGSPPLQHLGKLSYSIYLWHWPIIVFAKAAISPRPIELVQASKCFVLTLAFAQASYILVELPARRGKLLRSPQNALIGGLCMTGLMLTASFVSAKLAGSWLTSLVQEKIEAAGATEAIAHHSGCQVEFRTSTPHRCDFGDQSSPYTIVLIGDSHADQYSTALVNVALAKRWHLVTFLKSACSVSDLTLIDSILHRPYWECDEFRRQVVERTIALKPTLVIIGENSERYFEIDPTTWAEATKRVIRRFSDAGIRSLIIRDNPRPDRNIRNCLGRADWLAKSLATCNFGRDPALTPAIDKALRDIAASDTLVHIADLSNFFCDRECSSLISGTVVYRDGNHITVPISLLLQPQIESHISRAIEINR